MFTYISERRNILQDDDVGCGEVGGGVAGIFLNVTHFWSHDGEKLGEESLDFGGIHGQE